MQRKNDNSRVDGQWLLTISKLRGKLDPQKGTRMASKQCEHEVYSRIIPVQICKRDNDRVELPKPWAA